MRTYLSLCTAKMRSNARASLAVCLLFLTVPATKGADALMLHICLLSGCAEYQSDKSLEGFQSYLEGRYRVACHRAFGKDKGDDLPGLEALESADLMIVFTRRMKLPPDQLARIRKYI